LRGTSNEMQAGRVKPTATAPRPSVHHTESCQSRSNVTNTRPSTHQIKIRNWHLFNDLFKTLLSFIRILMTRRPKR